MSGQRNVLLIGGPLDGQVKAVLSPAREIVSMETRPVSPYLSASDEPQRPRRTIYQIEAFETPNQQFWIAFPTDTRVEDAVSKLFARYAQKD